MVVPRPECAGVRAGSQDPGLSQIDRRIEKGRHYVSPVLCFSCGFGVRNAACQGLLPDLEFADVRAVAGSWLVTDRQEKMRKGDIMFLPFSVSPVVLGSGMQRARDCYPTLNSLTSGRSQDPGLSQTDRRKMRKGNIMLLPFSVSPVVLMQRDRDCYTDLEFADVRAVAGSWLVTDRQEKMRKGDIMFLPFSVSPMVLGSGMQRDIKFLPFSVSPVDLGQARQRKGGCR